ncbi:hypothetical protein CDL12_07404 [Handroanthus impetiginosus]|uniref:RanBD1 domain-containing protein n=1 Tax=Handroanthus impetiginosus TaxID=429701 RepID=A0A2G9HQV9_9LAMI|nr:hypothetical protein CDL12_07404 [Handroanthus impetiginosus]
MRGTKRSSISDSAPIFNSNDSIIQSKRVTVGSPFAADKSESSIQQPPFDMLRAESSQQHVRALNTQFASWVQAQLQNHPDELWEDGVQDYLNHSKSIMDKFSDVVNWLKAHAAKAESSATTASFTTSWSPGIFSNNNAPFTFGGSQVPAPGNANSVPSNPGASNEADGEDDVEQPSSPSVKKSEEKGITIVHEVKCKLYVKSSDPADKDAWKDKGVGQLSIKCKEGVSKGTKESKPTIVIRNDVGKVLLNALLYPGIKTNLQKNSVVAIFHTSGDGNNNDTVVARTFLIRTKTEEDRDKLAAVIQEYAPAR